MTLKGTLMGWNCEPTAANLDLAQTLGTKWIGWGVEWPWLLNDETDHTSGFDSAALAALDADLARVHAKGMRAIVNFFGVPTSINASASNADGEWHYWPTNGAGDTAMAAAAEEVAGHLDPTLDWFRTGNELANTDFNRDDQTPARVGATQAAVISAVRTAYPTLTVIAGSLNAIGDTGHAQSIPVWGDAMVAANPTLLTSAAPTHFAVHPYIYGGGATGGTANPANSAGWNGHIQADQFRAALLARGWTDQGLVITEFGAPSQPPPSYTEDWQLTHAQSDYAVIDYRRAVGWYVGPEIRHNLIDVTITIDGNLKFGAWRADHTLKPVGWLVAARAATSIEATSAAPVAAFTWAKGSVPNSAVFTNLSTDATSFEWDFDDDAITESTAANPTYTYPAAGTYDCTLTVTGPGGSDSVTISVTVEDEIGIGDWDYDSAALPFDWTGLLDEPFSSSPPPVSGGMSVQVSLGIPARLEDGYFNLDDSVLDGTDLLAPDEVWHPLSGVVTEASWQHGVSVDRGRPEPGTMTLTAIAKHRDLDPLNSSGPYAPHLAENSRLRIAVDNVNKFTGTVTDISVKHEADHVVTIFEVVDGWGQLDNDLTWTPTIVEKSGARISRLLRLAGYTGPSFVLPGEAWMQAGTEQSGSAVEQIADCVAGEDGFAYFDGSGTFVFLDRAYMNSLVPTETFTDANGTGPMWSDADIGADRLTYWPRAKVRGIEEKSRWTVYGLPTSRKGTRTWKRTLPLAFESDRLALAQRIVDLFGEKRPRVRAAEFDPASSLTAADRGRVLAAGLGTPVGVRAAVKVSGTPETVYSPCIVAGEEGDVAPGYLRIRQTYQLGDSQHYFTLDDPTYGVLDGPYRLVP